MAKADITLRGRAYSIACAPGQETRIQLLAEQLNARVDQISGAVGDIGEERLLLIASLARRGGRSRALCRPNRKWPTPCPAQLNGSRPSRRGLKAGTEPRDPLRMAARQAKGHIDR